MNEKVAKALEHVDSAMVAKAATRKHRRKRFLVAVAAVLALVIFWRLPAIPLAVNAKAVSLPDGPKLMERPKVSSDEFDTWRDMRTGYLNATEASLEALSNFSRECSAALLDGKNSANQTWSPINAYIALAMTAELTEGHTRDEVLDVLGVADLETLRTGIEGIWETTYQNDGKEISVLSNSLWLDDEIEYQQSAMDILSQYYYAAVYQGDLGSEKTNKAIQTWLNNETGGFLKSRTGNVKLAQNSLMALASTIYFQSKWNDAFDKTKNTPGVFTTPDGNVTAEFMNAKEIQTNYYWGEDFGAVFLWLQNDSKMWLILPDEDKTVSDVLESGEYAQLFHSGSGFSQTNSKYMKVNLSLPKFDAGSSVDLKEALREMGLSGIFEPLGNNFSASVASDVPVYLDSIKQETRVAIDEDGVVAASYIILDFGAGAAMPPEEIIDFVLDRPFIFVITSSAGVPLFLGTIQNPTA